MSSTPLDQPLRLMAKRPLSADIWHLIFEAGSTLPRAGPGAHLALLTPSGAMRQYSIIAANANRIEIAVKRETSGRGGSKSLVDDSTVGDEFSAMMPENNFELVPAPGYLFIAGGIGITPILSMVRELLRSENAPPFTLVYCTRSAATTPFLDELNQLPADTVSMHYDYGKPDNFFDFWPLLETPDARHIYCCGPAPLMDAVRDMSGHWPMDAVHFEDFKPVEALRSDDQAFLVEFLDNAAPVSVAADQTLLEALRAAGLSLASSCESGTCGTCRLPLLDGDIDHRDLVLSPTEREHSIMCCVSRARAGKMRLAIPGPTTTTESS